LVDVIERVTQLLRRVRTIGHVEVSDPSSALFDHESDDDVNELGDGRTGTPTARKPAWSLQDREMVESLGLRLSGSSPIRPQPGLERGEQRVVLAGQHGARVEHDLIVADAGDHRRVGQAQRAGEIVGGRAGDRERAGR
jgi:hypothetical protein